MVDEFSDFARMPKPNMEKNDLCEIIRETVFLFQVSHSDIKFEIDVPVKPVIMNCDRRLMSQIITNLVKNAHEAIDPKSKEEGKIITRVRTRAGRIILEVIDNGKGLPKQNRSRLVEPYMTTREKGTGLGLAIVQKITEQHGGNLQLRDAPKRKGSTGGACMRIDFPQIGPREREDTNSTSKGASARKDQAKTVSKAKAKSVRKKTKKRIIA